MTNPAHTTRLQETRESKPIHEQWDDIDFEEQEQLGSKGLKALPGMVQRWVRIKLRGEDDLSNVSRQMQDGWKPRMADTVPKDVFATKVDFQGSSVIGKHDLILMHRPQWLHDKQVASVRNSTNNQLEAVRNNMFKAHEEGSGLTRPRMDIESKVERGRLPDAND